MVRPLELTSIEPSLVVRRETVALVAVAPPASEPAARNPTVPSAATSASETSLRDITPGLPNFASPALRFVIRCIPTSWSVLRGEDADGLLRPEDGQV